jgi:hypothetical protein
VREHLLGINLESEDNIKGAVTAYLQDEYSVAIFVSQIDGKTAWTVLVVTPVRGSICKHSGTSSGNKTEHFVCS